MPEDGHVWLVLHQAHLRFYLDLDINLLKTLCLKPVKYFKYLAWCILGVRGKILLDGSSVNDNDILIEKSLYFFIPLDTINPLGPQAIDMEALREKSAVKTNTRDSFKSKLVPRDHRCLFTGVEMYEGCHIVPFSKQDKWLEIIVESRPSDPLYPNDTQNLSSINDVRNGMLLSPNIHHCLDHREVAVLVTPNCILDIDDIPPRAQRPISLLPQIEYPPERRYTLQWLKHTEPATQYFVPHGSDATFQKKAVDPKPSTLLLAYLYGVAAVEMWGHNWKEVLSKSQRPDLRRPNTPEPPAMGPPRTAHDHGVVIRKCEGHNSGNSGNVGGLGSTSTKQGDKLDAGDFVLLCWANNPAAVERRKVKEDKFREGISDWISQITP